MREFLRTLTGVLIVLVVFYAGLLLFFISGPAMDDVDNLRTIVFLVLLLALVACSMLIFLGARMSSGGPTDERLDEAEAPAASMDDKEVMLEEYLGLSDEAAKEEAEDAEPDEDESEEGHA
jgi:hypothetical protein